MNLPDAPPTFRTPGPAERPWWWRLEAADGTEVQLAGEAAELADQRFASQGDAESWVGETWRELAEAGVAAVRLFELEREVYGPMGLEA